MSKKTSQKHILIVEDDEGISEVLKIILTEKGFSVAHVFKKDTAVSSANHTRPDLILLDVWLSGQSGLELVRVWKSQPETRKIPIVIISAGIEAKHIAQTAHADGFVTKPFEVDDLLSVIQKFLG